MNNKEMCILLINKIANDFVGSELKGIYEIAQLLETQTNNTFVLIDVCCIEPTRVILIKYRQVFEIAKIGPNRNGVGFNFELKSSAICRFEVNKLTEDFEALYHMLKQFQWRQFNAQSGTAYVWLLDIIRCHLS
jgi:hypothetical protein